MKPAIYEILFHVLILVILIIIVIGVIFIVGKEAWLMADMRNKCIHDCLMFNAEAIKQGIEEVCVC